MGDIHIFRRVEKKYCLTLERREAFMAEIADRLKAALLSEKQRAAYESKINQLKIMYPVDMTAF